jgi:AcrR family transcriptional regulator
MTDALTEMISTRERILVATLEILGRAGPTKLNLSDVAAAAGVSRPTLYRWFASKEELLAAFGQFEQDRFDAGVAAATAGLRGAARLEAVLAFIVDFQHGYSLRRIADVEPEHVLFQMTRVLPIVRERLLPYLSGPDAYTVATVVTRVALSHFMVPDDDPELFLRELRCAARLPARPND